MDTKLITRIAQVINEQTDGCSTGGRQCEDCRFFNRTCNYGRIVAEEILSAISEDYSIFPNFHKPTKEHRFGDEIIAFEPVTIEQQDCPWLIRSLLFAEMKEPDEELNKRIETIKESWLK